MDLDAQLRGFLEAAGCGDSATVGSWFSPDARFDFPPVLELEGRGHIQAFLETVRHNMAAIGVRGISFRPKRMVTTGSTSFVEWEVHSERAGGVVTFRGVLVLSWDGSGQIHHASAYTDPEAVRRVSVGVPARSRQTPAAVA